MQICRYTTTAAAAAKTNSEFGLLRESEVVPLTTWFRPEQLLDELWPTLHAATQLSDQQISEAEPVDGPFRLLAPVAPPQKILCVGLNYRDHAIETGAAIPEEPIIFSKLGTTLIGPGEPILLPAEAKRIDYEAELVVVIGKTCRRLSEQDAEEAIFGYACGHDVSARDWQKGRPGGQWLLGKSFDTFAPLGPAIVPGGQISDPGNLRVQMRINGETFQDSTTAQLIFSIPQVIAYISQVCTLHPGDLIYTGTPPGVGDARNPPRYLRDGDLCEVDIDGVGVLSNRCVADAGTRTT